jgi:hypothetical protein
LKGRYTVNGKLKGFSMAALLLALVIGLANPQAGLAQTGTSPSNPFALTTSGAQPETGTSAGAAVALPALAVHSTGQTISLTKVYQSPQAGSQVTAVIPPYQTIRLLGRSQDGTYFAYASPDGEVAGWISPGEVRIAQAYAKARSLVKVYQSPEDQSSVTGVLAPAQTVALIGRSIDGHWFAIAGDSFEHRMAGWVSRAEMVTDGASAQAASLVKVYRSPDDGSTVIGVIAPAQKMVLRGRNTQGNWFALTGEDNQGLTGWVATGEIKTSAAAADLPVLPPY